MSTTLADMGSCQVPSLIVSVVSMKLLSVASSLSHKRSSRTARHSDQLTKYCRRPKNTIESALLHVQVSIIVRLLLDGSSNTRPWRWFAVRQLHAVQHYPQVFCSSSTISVLSLYNTRSRLRCSYLMPTSFTVQIWKRIVCERLVLDHVQRKSRSGAMEVIHVYLNEHIQLVICRNCGAASHLSKLCSSRHSAMK